MGYEQETPYLCSPEEGDDFMMEIQIEEPTTIGGIPATIVRYKGSGSYNPSAIYVDDCSYCQSEKEAGEVCFPDHFAGNRCESGKHTHCSCDRCF